MRVRLASIRVGNNKLFHETAHATQLSPELQIVCRDRIWHLEAPTAAIRAEWIAAIASKMRRPNRFRVRIQGMLTKQGGIVKSWKARFFVVAADHVFYFDSKSAFDRFELLAGDDAENLHSSVVDMALGACACQPLVQLSAFGLF